MKTEFIPTFSLCALLLLSSIGMRGWGGACFAQNNLQFNQAIFQKVTNASCYQVPAGKVFKLEGFYADRTETCYIGTGCNSGIIFTISIFLNALLCSGSGGEHPHWPFPVWVPAGKYLFSSSATGGAISGIEFNIVP